MSDDLATRLTAGLSDNHKPMRIGALARRGPSLALDANERLVIAVDTLVQGVHFPDDTSAADLGHKALAVNLSDLAAMGADPVQKLVMPRVLAVTLALPLLTFTAIVLGVLGGMLVAQLQFNISPHFYLQTVTTTVELADFFAGVAKTFVFGWIIAMVGCFVGLGTQGGTAGVGRSTTQAVVASSILVLVSDFFLTKLLMTLPTEALLGRLLWAFG